ncbi:MAG: ATP-binding protein [Bacteroidales bacterium]|nr:ATP-binding protein [Bacteroidales bacterium]
MERVFYRDLLKWKESAERKPLIVQGARQVGKTWIMKHFGTNEYKQMIYVNCDEEPRMKEMFKQDYNIDRILFELQVISGIKATPHDTLIIFDEIQEVARGLHALKYFCENAREYHVMVAGSFLGIALSEGTSFPVGKVDIFCLYPMSFDEFLKEHNPNLHSLLSNGEWNSFQTFHADLVAELRLYYFLGGMPEVVQSYLNNGDLKKARSLQKTILNAYRNDFSKHSGKNKAIRIRQVFDSIPSQLVKENKKFIYNLIKRGARAAEYELAIQWLIDCGLVYKVSRVREMKLPLKFYEDLGAFKLFLLDCGLFGCLNEVQPDQILLGNTIFTEYKGSFTEIFVMQQLVAKGFAPYYWSKEQADGELDFIIQKDSKLIPIEVKAEENVRSRSLSQFIKDHPEYKGLRISMRGFQEQDWMINIPLYAINIYLNK